MLAYAAYGGPVDHRSSGPGSSGKSRLKVPAQPALLNGSLLFLHGYLKTGIQQGEVQKRISISFCTAYLCAKAIIDLGNRSGDRKALGSAYVVIQKQA
jgi:hypothetical protein